MIQPTIICAKDAVAKTIEARNPVIATDVETLFIEISKYLGIKKVIAPNMKPPLELEIASAIKAIFQFGANTDFFVLLFFESLMSFFRFIVNKTPYKIQKIPGIIKQILNLQQ